MLATSSTVAATAVCRVSVAPLARVLASATSSSSSVRMSSSSSSPSSSWPTLATFPYTLSIQTRWEDMDMYGHVNNVKFLSFFDTVVNHALITSGALDPTTSSVVGFCVHSECNYAAPIKYPSTITAAMGVQKLGTSSVQYRVGIFPQDSKPTATPAALGTFTHVFVSSDTQKAVPVSSAPALHSVLTSLLVTPPDSKL